MKTLGENSGAWPSPASLQRYGHIKQVVIMVAGSPVEALAKAGGGGSRTCVGHYSHKGLQQFTE